MNEQEDEVPRPQKVVSLEGLQENFFFFKPFINFAAWYMKRHWFVELLVFPIALIIFVLFIAVSIVVYLPYKAFYWAMNQVKEPKLDLYDVEEYVEEYVEEHELVPRPTNSISMGRSFDTTGKLDKELQMSPDKSKLNLNPSGKLDVYLPEEVFYTELDVFVEEPDSSKNEDDDEITLSEEVEDDDELTKPDSANQLESLDDEDNVNSPPPPHR